MVNIARVSKLLNTREKKIKFARTLIPLIREAYMEEGFDASDQKIADWLNRHNVPTHKPTKVKKSGKWYRATLTELFNLDSNYKLMIHGDSPTGRRGDMHDIEMYAAVVPELAQPYRERALKLIEDASDLVRELKPPRLVR